MNRNFNKLPTNTNTKEIKQAKVSIFTQALNLCIGGMSGIIAQSCVHPVEFIKMRIQVASEELNANLSMRHIAKTACKERGIRTFYTGIDAALVRQSIYCTLRMGLFYNLSDYMRQKRGGEYITPFQKFLASISAGAIAAFCANPCDISMIRAQADATLPPELRRGYRHFGDALYRMVREEGVTALWKGASPTIVRAMALNVGMLLPYEEIKERLAVWLGDTKKNYYISSCIAGFVASCVMLPFDNSRTKLMKMKTGGQVYKGLTDCLLTTWRREGYRGLWSGFLPFYCYVAPHVMISLTCVELFRKWLGVKA